MIDWDAFALPAVNTLLCYRSIAINISELNMNNMNVVIGFRCLRLTINSLLSRLICQYIFLYIIELTFCRLLLPNVRESVTAYILWTASVHWKSTVDVAESSSWKWIIPSHGNKFAERAKRNEHLMYSMWLELQTNIATQLTITTHMPNRVILLKRARDEILIIIFVVTRGESESEAICPKCNNLWLLRGNWIRDNRLDYFDDVVTPVRILSIYRNEKWSVKNDPIRRSDNGQWRTFVVEFDFVFRHSDDKTWNENEISSKNSQHSLYGFRFNFSAALLLLLFVYSFILALHRSACLRRRHTFDRSSMCVKEKERDGICLSRLKSWNG